MPIKVRTDIPVKKINRVSRSVRDGRVKFLKTEKKGYTAAFDGLMDYTPTSAEMAPRQVPDPYTFQIANVTSPSLGMFPLEPVYRFETLALLAQKSNILRQCIEAYVTNIEGYGHTLEYVGPEGKEDTPRVQAEKVMLESFLSNCAPDLTLREVRERSRWDMETIGSRFFEISRDMAGRIVMMDHIPGITLRRTKRELDATEVVIEVPNPADPSQVIRKTAARHFCRFIQMSFGSGGWRRVFFKEFGDPRPISPVNGLEDPSLSVEEQATEVLMLTLYTPGAIYGLPRWFGQLPSLLGSRESEMVNLNFFRENAIPAMAVLISGGALTQESFDALEQYIQALRGQKSMNRILVLEAQSDDTKGDIEKGVARTNIDMKPMVSERQQDGLFKDYDTANQAKVRSSFRLPAIYTGRSEDYTRATAFASMVTVEQQVFAPERSYFDDIMNNKILRTHKPRYWKYKSGGIPIVDPETMATMLKALDATGALTPNAVIKIANRVLAIEIKPVTEAWGDFPFQAILQYVNQGRSIKGLTEFIVDLDAASQLPPPAGGNPAITPSPSNDRKKKPVPVNDSKKKPKSKIKKAQFTFELQQMIRKELGNITDDFKSLIVEAVQVSAR